MDSGTLFTLAARKTCINRRNNRLTHFSCTLFPGFSVSLLVKSWKLRRLTSQYFNGQREKFSDGTVNINHTLRTRI